MREGSSSLINKLLIVGFIVIVVLGSSNVIVQNKKGDKKGSQRDSLNSKDNHSSTYNNNEDLDQSPQSVKLDSSPQPTRTHLLTPFPHFSQKRPNRLFNIGDRSPSALNIDMAYLIDQYPNRANQPQSYYKIAHFEKVRHNYQINDKLKNNLYVESVVNDGGRVMEQVLMDRKFGRKVVTRFIEGYEGQRGQKDQRGDNKDTTTNKLASQNNQSWACQFQYTKTSTTKNSLIWLMLFYVQQPNVYEANIYKSVFNSKDNGKSKKSQQNNQNIDDISLRGRNNQLGGLQIVQTNNGKLKRTVLIKYHSNGNGNSNNNTNKQTNKDINTDLINTPINMTVIPSYKSVSPESIQNLLVDFLKALEIHKYEPSQLKGGGKTQQQQQQQSNVDVKYKKIIDSIKKGSQQGKGQFIIVYGECGAGCVVDVVVNGNNIKEQRGQNQKVINKQNNQNNSPNQHSLTSFPQQIYQLKRQNVLSKYYGPTKYKTDSPYLQHILFNLLAGITYYHGSLLTQNSILTRAPDYSYTFTPSRLIFPRSFLWDDGFHMMVVIHTHKELVLPILHNWIKKVDLFGWVAREQIRGNQVAAKLPDMKFMYQDVLEMNPPTIMLPIVSLVEQYSSLKADIRDGLDLLLSEDLWKIEKLYRYMKTTQSHLAFSFSEDIIPNRSYRWRCKDSCEKNNFMGSGLDDYPRVQAESQQMPKQQVDIACWLYFFADSLRIVHRHLGDQIAQQHYRRQMRHIASQLVAQNLELDTLLFKDVGVHSKYVYTVEYVSANGYITLFPFMTGAIREIDDKQMRDKMLNRLLDLMLDEEELLSNGGLRSLSKKDPLYGSDDNYWRGAVWMPINYMVLRACKRFYWDNERVKELYGVLRDRIKNTVRKNYQARGYLFENYLEGLGNRGYPFYGWTALVLNIQIQAY